MQTSKSSISVLKLAYEVGKRALAAYSCSKSPHLYTQPQLFACLVLKEFGKLDYRSLRQQLEDIPTYREILELEGVPHYTTIQKACHRLLSDDSTRELLDKLVEVTVEIGLLEPKTVSLAAIDSTAFESRHASRYYKKQTRWGKKGAYKRTHEAKRYPTVTVAVDCKTHLALAFKASEGPEPDITPYKTVIPEACRRMAIDTLLADRGYDAEVAHTLAREKCGIRLSVIPTYPHSKKAKSEVPLRQYRRQMFKHFPRRCYRQRAQVETFHSMLKRLLGSALRARSLESQGREIALRVLTLNMMVN